GPFEKRAQKSESALRFALDQVGSGPQFRSRCCPEVAQPPGKFLRLLLLRNYPRVVADAVERNGKNNAERNEGAEHEPTRAAQTELRSFFLDLLHFVENCLGEPDAVTAQSLHAQRSVAACAETPHYLAPVRHARPLEREDVLHIDLIAFHAGH